MRLLVVALLTAVLGALALAPAAGAAPKTTTYRVGPIDVGPYQVRQSDIDIGIPTPDEDGYVTGMEVDIVDADGSKVPIKRLMLHHIVFSNLGTEFGEKRDGTCSNFTALDSRTELPGSPSASTPPARSAPSCAFRRATGTRSTPMTAGA